MRTNNNNNTAISFRSPRKDTQQGNRQQQDTARTVEAPNSNRKPTNTSIGSVTHTGHTVGRTEGSGGVGTD